MKLCIITCYKQPDYIRARTLRSAAELIDGTQVVVVKNVHTGLLRYPEVIGKVIRARLLDKPDAYLLTFRGYEMLLPIRLLSMGKPLIYDEFINPIEWVSYEHKKIGRYNPITLALWLYYRILLATVDLILTDTNSHADLSARMMKLRRDKFVTLPVGTDESVFSGGSVNAVNKDRFTVFYYGNMLPLHGLSYVIATAQSMSNESVKFVLVGGSERTARETQMAIAKGANIDHKAWVDFDKLPKLMREADLCLAGPFGNTFQSQYVITGKAYQYMAMGRPTLIGQNKESAVFTNEKNVLIIPQADSAALAETIRWAMNHRKELEVIGGEGRKLYEREFSIRVISKRLEEALAKL